MLKSPVFTTQDGLTVHILGATRICRNTEDNDGQIRPLPYLHVTFEAGGSTYRVDTVSRRIRDFPDGLTNQMLNWQKLDCESGRFWPCETFKLVYEAGEELWYVAHDLIEQNEEPDRRRDGTIMPCVLCSADIAPPGACICESCQPVFSENAPGN